MYVGHNLCLAGKTAGQGRILVVGHTGHILHCQENDGALDLGSPMWHVKFSLIMDCLVINYKYIFNILFTL